MQQLNQPVLPNVQLRPKPFPNSNQQIQPNQIQILRVKNPIFQPPIKFPKYCLHTKIAKIEP